MRYVTVCCVIFSGDLGGINFLGGQSLGLVPVFSKFLSFSPMELFLGNFSLTFVAAGLHS